MKEANRLYDASEAALAENTNELGVIRIHENVISAIVRKAACSVQGVNRLSGSTFVDNIAEIVRSRKIHDRAIGIEFDGDSAQINVKINIEYGFNIPEIAEKIQTKVMEEVHRLTGIEVRKVNVIIQHIEDPELEDIEEDEEIQ